MAEPDAGTALRVTVAEALARLGAERRFTTVFEAGEALSVELYAPVGTDPQTPHDRDELYVVIAGSGTFRRGAVRVPFGPGDLLYVAAHVPHRFETFSAGFSVWVIFYGPSHGA